MRISDWSSDVCSSDLGEAVELFFAGFGAIGEIGMRGGFVEVERLDIGGDHADQPFAGRELGDVDRGLRKPARREQFEQPVAQQIDRADLAVERLADDLNDRAQLRRCRAARSHHVMKARSEEHTSELQSLMRISYAVFCLKKKTNHEPHQY